MSTPLGDPEIRNPENVEMPAATAWPLVLGLGNFARVSTIPEIAYAFTQVFRTWRPGKSTASQASNCARPATRPR